MTTLRSRLFHGTAVAAALAFAPVARADTSLPTGGTIQVGTVTTKVAAGGLAGSLGGTAGAGGLQGLSADTTKLAVTFTVGTPSAVVNWTNFNIDVAKSATFVGAGNAAFSILNRVQSGASPTLIAGTLQGNSAAAAGNRGTIFVVNEAGISFANSATVTNLTGIVASSLGVTDTEFGHFVSGDPLGTQFVGLGSGVIHIDADAGAAHAVIAPDSVLLLVAPKLDVLGGALTAKDTTAVTFGDAGFVLARDATVNLSPTSIISMRIDKGTEIGGSVLSGTVGGQRVLLAAASAPTLIGTLLGVTASFNATTVAATDKGIVIAVGRDTPIDASNSITFTPPSTGPVVIGAQLPADVTVSGALSSSGRIDANVSGNLTVGDIAARGGGVALRGDGGLIGTTGHTIAAASDVVLKSDGAIAVDAVRAGGSLTVGGATGTKTLSVTGDTLRAGGGVTVDSIGVITVAGTSNVSVASTGFKLDPTLAAFTGTAVAAADVTLTAGGTVTLNDAASTRDIIASGTNFILGTAGAVHSLTPAAAVKLTVSDTSATAIVTRGDFRFAGGVVTLLDGGGLSANITEDDTLTLSGASIKAGNIASSGVGNSGSGDVKLTATGAASSDAVVAGSVAARGAVIASSANGDVTLGGAISGSPGAAVGDVTVTAARHATVSGAVTSTGNYTVIGGDVTLGGAAIIQKAAGDVLIKATATGGIAGTGSLTVDSGDLGSHRLVLDSGAGAITGTLNLSSGVLLQSDILLAGGGDIALGTIGARQLAGAATVAAPASVASYTVTTADTLNTAGAISLGAVTTKHGVTIGSTSIVAGHQDVAIGSITSDSGIAVSSLGNVTLGGATSGAGPNDIVVTAAKIATVSGAITSAQDYSVTGGDVVLGKAGSGAVTQSAARAVSITATTGAITSGGTAAVDALSLISNSGAASAAGVGTLSLKAKTSIGDAANPSLINVFGGAPAATTANRRAISLDVLSGGSGAITLGTVRGAAVTTPGAAPFTLQATGAITLGAVDVDIGAAAGDTNIVSSGAVRLTSLKASGTGNVAIGGTTIGLGLAGAAGSLSTSGAATNSIMLTASGGGAAAVTILGDFSITAPGAVLLQQSTGVAANVTQNDSLAISGQNVALGNVASTAGGSFGTGAVTLTATGSASTDNVTAGTVAARGAVGVTSTSGDVSLGGATSGSTVKDITVKAAGLATVSGDVTATGGYFVNAKTVTIGGAATNQTTIGDVLIQATGGNLVARGTIIADNGATPTGTQALVLDSFGSITGGANLRAGSTTLPATAANRSNALLRFDPATGLVLGNIDADIFAQATAAGVPASIAGYTSTGVVATTGAITLGAVRTVAANNIEAKNLLTLGGDTSATGAVALRSTLGDVTLSGPVVAHGNVTLKTDNGIVTIGDVSAFGGDVIIGGATGIAQSSGGPFTIAAGGDVTLRSDGAVILGNVRAGTGIAVQGLTGLSAASLTGRNLQANRAISVKTSGVIDLTAGLRVATERNLLNQVTLTAFDGTPPLVPIDANVTLTSGGAIDVNTLASTGGIMLNGAGTVTVSGKVDAGDASTAAGGGNYTIIGGNVVLGGASIAQTARDNILVRSTVGGINAAGTLTAGGKLVADSAASISIIPALSAAKLVAGTDVLLRTGGGGAIVLGDISGNRLASAQTTATPPSTAADYTPRLDALVGTLSTDGAITFGTVNTVQSHGLFSTGTAIGARDVTFASDTTTGALSNIEVGSSNGAVTFAGLVSARGGVFLHADFAPADAIDPTRGKLSAGNVSAFGGNVILVGGTAIAAGPAHTIAALGNVNLSSSGAIVVDIVHAGGALTIGGIAPGSAAASLAGSFLESASSIDVKTTGDIGASNALINFTGQTRAIDANLLGFNGSPQGLPGSDVTLTSTGGSVLVNNIFAPGNATVTASGTARIQGYVVAGIIAPHGNYTVNAATAILSFTSRPHQASGDVWIRGTSSINVRGQLIADSNGAGGRRLVLDSGGTIDGGAALIAGIGANRSDILIRAGANSPLAFADIDANQLASATATTPLSVADYTVTTANTLKTTGLIGLGAVTTVQSNTIVSGGSSSGQRNVTVVSDASSLGAVDIGSDNGAVTVSGTVTAKTSVNLHADSTVTGSDQGVLTTGSNITAKSGSATLTGGTRIARTGSARIAASGNVVFASTGAIGADTVVAGGTITTHGLVVGAVTTLPASFSATSLQANGGIAVTTSGAITLTGAGTQATATKRKAIDSGFAFTGGDVADADITLTTTRGTITANDGAATGDLKLTAGTDNVAGTGAAAGAIVATGVFTAGDGSTAVTSGSLVFDARGDVTLPSGTAMRDIKVTSRAGDAKIQTAVAGARADALTNAAASGLVLARSLAATGRATIDTGTATRGDVSALATQAGGIALITTGVAHLGNIRADGDVSATIASGVTDGAALGDVVAHSALGDATVTFARAGGNVTADAFNAALITDARASFVSAVAPGDVRATSRATAAGAGSPSPSATITDGTGHFIVADAQIGTAHIGSGISAISGDVTAAVHAGAGLASVTSATASGGNAGATQSGSGDATIGTATAGGNVFAQAGGLADIVASGTAGGDVTASGGTAHIKFGDAHGNVRATASQAAAIDTGTAATGDVAAASTSGDATITIGNAGTNVLATAFNAALITKGTAASGDVRATSTATAIGAGSPSPSATIADGTGHAVIADAKIGTAAIATASSSGGDITATVHTGNGVASITTATATGGNVIATQLGGGNATIGTSIATLGTAGTGNVFAQAGSGLADIVIKGKADGDVTATGATAHIKLGDAHGNVRAVAGASATIDQGIAAVGNVDATASGAATMTSGTATLGNVRATSAGGLATITLALAGQSVTASGVAVNAADVTAGDDIVLLANGGNVNATKLTVSGLAASDFAATDANNVALMFGGVPVTGLGGSNVIIRATGAATVTGVVAVAQPNAAKSANFDIAAGSIILGASGVALDQKAAGRVDLVATGGGVTFAGTGGSLQSNVSGKRVALTDGTTAGGGLTIISTGGIIGSTTGLVASAATLAGAFDTQARQPGVTLAAAGSVAGIIRLASITGGAVSATAPASIAVPLITATGGVSLKGSAPSGNDIATISPTTIAIDGLNAGYGRVDVTVAGGAGAEVTRLTTVNGGQVGTLQILSDAGAATLRATPNDPAKITAILVESQTGAASILNPAGGPATSANPNTVAAGTIVLRGRQFGSSVVSTGPLLATGSILATGPSVILGTVAVAGTSVDGPGDILIAATGAASLAAGADETATARRSIKVTGDGVILGSGTATGGTLALDGGTVVPVTIIRNATAGDDILLSSRGVLNAAAATLTTTGTADLQGGDNGATVNLIGLTRVAGAEYGTGHTVLTDAPRLATDAVTGQPLTRLAGSNMIITAAGNVQLGSAVLTANNDLRLESGGTIVLASATAGRALVAAATGDITPNGTLTAGDDIVLVTGGALDLHAATLVTTGTSAGLSDARRGDGSLLTSPAGGGTLTDLAGSTIALSATGPITLGRIQTSGVAPASLRAFSSGDVSTTQAITTSGSLALTGATVASPFALTAGDDIVVVARGGAATLGGILTTTGAAASDTPLRDLAGASIVLPGEAALGRVDGSSILVAATGIATVSNAVTSAGRYTILGRGGISLGTAVTPPATGTLHSAASDVLLEASIGAVPAPASVTLANGMTLVSNSDSIGTGGGFAADPLVIRIGNGALLASGATLRAQRTTGPVANATLAFQPTVQVQPVVTDGVKSIAIGTLDSASADLRALGNVVVGGATVDAGLTLASKAGLASLTTLTIGSGVPLMTAAETGAIDLKITGATGATLGDVAATGTNLLRDITVATTGGDAIITGAARASDDIVVASATGKANAGDLTFAGAASDSESGNATLAATDANGVALADPYQLGGATITGLAGRNIVVAGATGASLGTVTTLASGGLGDVRVTAAAGPATLTTVNTGGAGLPARVIVATRNGAATGTTLNASGDIIVDATVGSATLTSGTVGRDGIVVGQSVSIGTLTAGDDIVAVATSGALVAGTLISTGANSGDTVATIARADGSAIVDPVAGGSVGGLLGGNVVALASGNATVTSGLASAAAGASSPGMVRVGADSGAARVTTATATAGDIVITGSSVDATTLSAGRDAGIRAVGLATIARLTAGRDITITAGSGNLASGTGLIAAQRNLILSATGPLTIGTARAGATLNATANTVTAARLDAGDALTVLAAANATVTTANSTGRPLLADFSGFAATGSAAGTTRDINITAGSMGIATLITGTAVHGIKVAGMSAVVTTATANTGGTDGDLTVTGTAGAATLGTGSGRDIRIAATGGAAKATTAAASRDLFVDAAASSASLTTGTAGRDGVVVGSSVSIGSLVAGDDVVAVANAGTLLAGTLTSTGANSGDGIAIITRASGAAVTDPVAGGAVGGLLGGNVVALASGDVTVTSATATAAATPTASGLVRIASLGGMASVTTATASAGDISIAGVAINAGTLTAGRDASLTASGGMAAVASVGTGRDLGLTAAIDIVVSGTSNASGTATFAAGRDINLAATATGNALTTGGATTLTSGRDIIVAQRISAGSTLEATASGMAALSGATSTGATTIATQGNFGSTADVTAGGSLTLTSAAGTISAPALTGNGIAVAAAGAVTVSGAVISTAGLTAIGDSLVFGSVDTGGDATLRGVNALAISGTTRISGALTATSDSGTIRTGGVTSGAATLTAAGTDGAIALASLMTTGAATLRAGQSVEVTGAAKTTGALTATAMNASLKFGAIDSGGAALLRARTGITVAGLTKSGAALDALSSAGALSFGATQAAASVTLRGAQGVAITGTTTASGTVNLTADSGAVTSGDIAGGDTLVTAAAGSATLGSVSRAGKLTIAASGDATITGGATTSGDTSITSTTGSAAVGGAVRTANYTVKAVNGSIALGAGVIQASSGTVTLDSQRLTIGAGTAVVAATRVQLDVTGNAAGVSLGDGAGAAAGTTKYALAKADLRKFQTPVLEIAAAALPVDIGEVDFDGITPVAGGLAGVSNAFGIRTTGDIRVADRLSFTSATGAPVRVLTLGGAAGGTDLDKTTPTASAIKVMATSALDNGAIGTGGQINAAGSTVQLRATYIALGETPSPVAGRPFIDALLPAGGTPLTTTLTKTQFVDNASSTLYVGIPPYAKQTPAPQAIVKAGTLVLAPGQWALIQNTGLTTTPGGGIEIGTLKLNKVAGSGAADPVIAVFGSLAGKTGVASAISVNAANLDGISPSNIRVNGCVALSTAGCIQAAVAIPLINLADPGRTLLISSAPDLALSVELITGATNEALWREDDDEPGQNRPQRESRP